MSFLDPILQIIAANRWFFDPVYAFAEPVFAIILYLAVFLTIIYFFMTLVSIFFKKDNDELPFDMKLAPFVTIQIPTRNELIALRCAECCLAFDYPKDKYEILIGDDSNQPDVSYQLQEFANSHQGVKVFKREQNVGFKPGNLNNLLQHTKGEIIVIFDSDYTPEPDFLKRLIAPFVNDPKVSTVQARWNFNNFSQNLVTIMASTIIYVFHHVNLTFLHAFDTSSLCGSAEAVKKKDLVELGGWKSGCLTEDVEYSLRLHKANKKMVYLPNLECYSEVPYIAKDLYKQQMRWAYGVVGAYIFHIPGILFNKGISFKRKLLSMCAGFGYLFPITIMFMFIFGTMKMISYDTASPDVVSFTRDLLYNISLTSGMLVASFYSMYKAKRIRYSLEMILASFSVGLVTTYYVNKGIFKSVIGQPMDWFLLAKKAN
ncbi:MAG: glycosyltransferase [Candidatus Woesearchaeota archaeon]